MSARRPLAFTAERIDMSHGAGGGATRRLVEGLFVPALDNAPLAALADAALLPPAGGRLALTTDAFVVRPLRFPGGSIGELAVNGTVNDLAVSGAVPLALSAAFILEEGLEGAVLRAEVEAMAAAARRAGVPVAAGDTKVVERGRGDGLYVVTAGIGAMNPAAALSPAAARPGDRVLCSGTLGDHGVAILLARGDLELEAEVRSDTRSLAPLAAALLRAAGPGLRFMRDPTRGGAATALNELARDSGRAVLLREEALPVREAVRGACELLGIDPLYVANEGKLLAVVAPEAADAALAAARAAPGGQEACFIGEIAAAPAGTVVLHTRMGGARVVDVLAGDPLPRIC